MRIGKWIGLLAVMCLLCTGAMADGTQAVGMPSLGEQPTGWMTQETGEYPEYLIDGNIYTVYQHICQNSTSYDNIPDITFYFNNATLKNIWIRNGDQSDPDAYYAYARIRQLNVTIYTADGSAVTYRFQLQDSYDPDNAYTGWVAGYQCVALPRTFRNVTRVELWIPGWQQGNVFPDTVCIGDIAFYPNDYANSPQSTYQPYQPSQSTYQPYQPSQPTYQPYQPYQPGYQPTPQPTPYNSWNSYHPQVRLNQRLATRSGPGTQYTELGSYFQGGEMLTAVSAAYDDRNEIWWIQTEFTYNGEKRRAYTGLKRLDMQASDVPQEYLIRYAVVNRSIYAYWGPGYDYAMYKDPIPAGTEGAVWQIENGYAQIEFYDSSEGKTRRVWIPESALEAYNG